MLVPVPLNLVSCTATAGTDFSSQSTFHYDVSSLWKIGDIRELGTIRCYIQRDGGVLGLVSYSLKSSNDC